MRNYFKFGPVVLEQTLNISFSNFSSGGHFVQWSGTTCAIFKEGNMGNMCVKFFGI